MPPSEAHDDHHTLRTEQQSNRYTDKTIHTHPGPTFNPPHSASRITA